MKIESIAGFAVIAKELSASQVLYRDRLGLPFKKIDDYLHMDRFPGANHFGVWSLELAARHCFGRNDWPADLPEPQATIEFELADTDRLMAAVDEMKSQGQQFVHDIRVEPWGQSIARFMSPEGLLVGLSHAPWLHAAASA